MFLQLVNKKIKAFHDAQFPGYRFTLRLMFLSDDDLEKNEKENIYNRKTGEVLSIIYCGNGTKNRTLEVKAKEEDSENR